METSQLRKFFLEALRGGYSLVAADSDTVTRLMHGFPVSANASLSGGDDRHGIVYVKDTCTDTLPAVYFQQWKYCCHDMGKGIFRDLILNYIKETTSKS